MQAAFPALQAFWFSAPWLDISKEGWGVRHFFASCSDRRAAVGAAFITPAFGVNPGGANGHGGRDECCPYRRSLALANSAFTRKIVMAL
jgi:hypothetical protein